MKNLVLFSSLFILFFCVSNGQNYKNDGEKAFKKRNYLSASINWVEFLNQAKKPGRNYKFKCDLSTSLVEAEPTALARINHLTSLSNAFLGDRTVSLREAIVSIYDSLSTLERRFNALPDDALKTKKCPMLSFSVGDFATEREEAQGLVEVAKEKAAEMHYKQGLKRLSMEGLENGRAAYREFARAEFFGAMFEDLQQKKEEAHQMGIKRIIIVPLANNSNFPYTQVMGEEIKMLAQGNLAQDQKSGYWIEFVQPEALALKMGVSVSYLNIHINNGQAAIGARELDVDEVWGGGINQVIAPRPKTTYSDHEGSKKIKVGTKKVVNDKGKERTENVYETQKYFYRTFTKSVSGQINGTFKYLEVQSGQANPVRTWKETYNESTLYKSKGYLQ